MHVERLLTGQAQFHRLAGPGRHQNGMALGGQLPQGDVLSDRNGGLDLDPLAFDPGHLLHDDCEWEAKLPEFTPRPLLYLQTSLLLVH